MNSVTLPQDLISGHPAKVAVLDYHAEQESFKQQVNLTMNTFSFLVEGNKEVITDTDAISIEENAFLLMKAGHCLMTEKFSTKRDHYRSILLFFSNDMLFDFVRKYGLKPVQKKDNQSAQAFQYDGYIKNFTQSLQELSKMDYPDQSVILALKLEEILLYLIQHFGLNILSSLLHDSDSHSYSFINVVESNKLKKLTLKELAFLSNMSLSTFKREFEKHFQDSPSKWFQAQRLNYAAFLLRNERRRPSDIFQEIGYESLSNFIQGFKSKFGMTPKQYQGD